MILSGDIGGTNTRLAIYRDDGGGPSPEDEATFPSGRYPGLGPIVAGFLEARGARPDRACFGVPGPVRGRAAASASGAGARRAHGTTAAGARL